MSTAQIALAVSMLSLAVAAAGLFYGRFAPPHVRFDLGSWIGLTFDMATGPVRATAIRLEIGASNAGAQPAHILDMALLLRRAGEQRVLLTLHAKYDVAPPKANPQTEKAEMPHFRGLIIPGHDSVTRSLIFVAAEHEPISSLDPGTYSLQISFRLREVDPSWKHSHQERLTITREALQDLASLPLETVGNLVRSTEWRTHWSRTESATRALDALKRGHDHFAEG